ncbi:MAG: hypothetical protein IJ865_07975, partial [Clostridia bacterium]|nr:hypothetical protein [Clostridia bacterium]
MKHYTNKLTALLLAALLMVTSIAQYACAEETVYNTETKFPLLEDVRTQLDEDETVVAYDVIINRGDYFDPADVSAFKVEKTDEPTKKVEIHFFSAHAMDGTAFSSDIPGSYFAYYIVKPVSGHPIYEASRRITVNVVEEPSAPVVSEAIDTVPENEPADEDSEDDPHEESQTDDSEETAYSGEAEPDEEPDDAKEFPEAPDVSEKNDAETDPAEWMEEPEATDPAEDTNPGNGDYPGEYGDAEDSEEGLPPENAADETPDENEDVSIAEPAAEEESAENLKDEDTASIGDEGDTMPDEGGEESEATPEPSLNPAFDMPQIYDEPIKNPDFTERVPEEVPDTDNIDGVSGNIDGTADDAKEELSTEDAEGYTLSGNDLLMTLADLGTEDLSLVSAEDGEDSDATESDDDWEDIDPDNIVLEGDAKMVRGSKVTYPSALGSWSTFKYTVDGKMAYCLESAKSSPKGGSFAQEILDSNPNLTKALYYGYGGPGDLSASFFPDYSANV